jgi:hypothetical protein
MSMKRKVNYTNRYVVIDPTSFNNDNDIVYQHFNQPDHSVLSMGD